MASINDSSSIFVGAVLDQFNEMELLVARDGDVSYAQSVMSQALLKVIQTTALPSADHPGGAVTDRAPL